MTRSIAILAALWLLAMPAAHAQAQAKPAQPARPAAAKSPADAAFQAWDKDHDGKLSQVEFRAGWQQVQRAAEVQAGLRHQFGVLDANRNKALDVAEYANLELVKKAGKAAPPLARFDANANGRLEFNEYVRAVQALAPRENTGAAKQ